MPLDGDNELIPGSFNSLDDTIFDTPRRYGQTIAGMVERLVMTAIHQEFGEASDLGNARTLGDRNPMGVPYLPSRLVVYASLKILDEAASAPDIPGLQPVTDAEERLVEICRVLHQELVDSFAGGIGRSAFRSRSLPVPFRIYIGAASGQKHPFTRAGQLRDLSRSRRQRNPDGFSPNRLDCVGILRP